MTPTPSNGRKRFFNEIDNTGNEENTGDSPARPQGNRLFSAQAHQNHQTLTTNNIEETHINIHDDLRDDISEEIPLPRRGSSRVTKLPNALADYVTTMANTESTPNNRNEKTHGGGRGSSRRKRGGNHGGASGSR